MRVRMLVRVSGTRDGSDWPPVGGTIDVPAAEAADLVACGLAVPAAPGPETADAPPPERAVARRTPRR